MSEWVDRCPTCGDIFVRLDLEQDGEPRPEVQVQVEIGRPARITVTCAQGHSFEATEWEWSQQRGHRAKVIR